MRGQPAHPDELAQHVAIRLLQGNGELANWTLARGEQRWQGMPSGNASANSPELLIRLACAGAGIVAATDVRRGALQRLLPQWCTPSHAAWAGFPECKLMPQKTRVFIDMLQSALGRVPG